MQQPIASRAEGEPSNRKGFTLAGAQVLYVGSQTLEALISLANNAPTPDANTLTAADLADRWQMTKQHLANLRWLGDGPAYLKLGSTVRYRLVDVEAYERAALVTTRAVAA